jgi:uroporphyrinogen decarboxylase
MPAMTPKERFLAAAARRPVDRPPVWILRQAGRYLPEYQAVRRTGSFLELVRDPARAAEITMQPIRRFGMDAAVIFSDILVPVAAMGLDVSFEDGEGPRIGPPLRGRGDLGRIAPFDPEEATGFVGAILDRVRSELGQDRAILGFAGAPFTTASYMIEGGASRDFEHTKRWMWSDPSGFRELVELIVDALIPYLGYQIEAGADAVQIFDSWGGALDAATYRRLLFGPMERLVTSVQGLGRPVILYVNGAGHLLEVLADLEPEVIGLDWRVDPGLARAGVGSRCALQGNLDPTALLAPPGEVVRLVSANLRAFGPAPGHIVNLGSGVLPSTPVESVAAFVRTVQEWQWP